MPRTGAASNRKKPRGHETVYALDAATIDLCLSVFPWAPFRTTKAAVKLHTLLDLRGNIPASIHVSDGKMHDVNVLDRLLLEARAFYVMDRGYSDFESLFRLYTAGSFFVTRGNSNLKAQRRYSRPVHRSTGLICDQTVVLTGLYSSQDIETPLRRIRFNDPKTGKRLVFLTSNFVLQALTITELHRAADGRSSSSSSGSSSIFGSSSSTARPRTP